MESSFISMQDLARICLKKSNSRTDKDLSKLADATKNVSVFQSIKERQGEFAHLTCCKYLSYEFHEQGTYVFKERDIGYNFYILIRGTISVEKTVISQETGEIQTVKLISLTDGAQFGEIALEQNKPRTASILCKTDSHFFTLSKADFDMLMAKILKEKKIQLVNFLKELPVFRNLNINILTNLVYSIKEEKYNRGNLVFSEGEIGETMYIVLSGEFLVTKRVHLSIPQPARTNTIKSLLRKRVRERELLIISRGELIGEVEAIEGCQREFTCKCQVPGKLLVIRKEDLKRRINSDAFLRSMKQSGKQKFLSMANRAQLWVNLEETKFAGQTLRSAISKRQSEVRTPQLNFSQPKNQAWAGTSTATERNQRARFLTNTGINSRTRFSQGEFRHMGDLMVQTEKLKKLKSMRAVSREITTLFRVKDKKHTVPASSPAGYLSKYGL